MSIALAAAGGGELAVAGLEMLGISSWRISSRTAFTPWRTRASTLRLTS